MKNRPQRKGGDYTEGGSGDAADGVSCHGNRTKEAVIASDQRERGNLLLWRGKAGQR